MSAAPRQGFALWLTGLPASGKTTLAHALRAQLAAAGTPAVVLDGDELRGMLTPEPRYTAAERDWLYGVIADLATWLCRSGVNVLIAATANRRAYRDRARAQIDRFAEVYVRCAAAICRARDPKGLYRQAAAGTMDSLPGVGAAYEPPLAPEATVDTDHLLPDDAARMVLAQLGARVEGACGDGR